MQADKFPRPDGFNPGFTKWDIRKGDIQTSMKYWRPIALCNMVYKIMAKIIVNRLKVVLDKCICVFQSAFVLGRSILVNALLTIELINDIKAKTRGTLGDVVLKIDIIKPKDRLRNTFVMLCFIWVSYQKLVHGAQILNLCTLNTTSNLCVLLF